MFLLFFFLGEGGIFDNIGRVGVAINGKPLKSTGHSQLFCSLILIPAVYSTNINYLLGLLVRFFVTSKHVFLTCFYMHIEFTDSL